MDDRLATLADVHAIVGAAVQSLLDGMARMEQRLRTELGADLKRHVDAAHERFLEHLRVMNDERRADRDRLDAHIADDSVHKRPRRARR
jgi:hypothetical protein